MFIINFLAGILDSNVTILIIGRGSSSSNSITIICSGASASKHSTP